MSRLLWLQGVTALSLVAIFLVFFYWQQSRAVSALQAELWAPALQAALGVSAQGAQPLAVQRRAAPPQAAVALPLAAPRAASLVAALAGRGVLVQGMAVEPAAAGARLWLQVQGAGREPWLGMESGEALKSLPLRILAAFGLGTVIVVGVSVVFVRRLLLPLRAIERAMAEHRATATAAWTAPAAATLAPHAAPELRAIATAWHDQMQRLQRHESERGLMLAGISHDLRGPLARIRMAAELLPGDDGTVARRRESIVRNVGVADALIGSFLDFVRAGELALGERCDLVAIAQDVVGRLKGAGAEAAAADALGGLTLQTPSTPQTLWLDNANKLLVERLMVNLVENALRHGRPPVVLRIAATSAGSRAAARIEVSDGGPGLSAAEWVRATQAFARGDASRSVAGSGLGLAIVQRIVDRLGGRCEAARAADGRFVVGVSLPDLTADHAAGVVRP